MPAPPEDQPLPRWVNPKKFAHQGVKLSGRIALGELSRLQQATAQEAATPSPPVRAELDFHLDAEGQRVVSGHLEAGVFMTCQRCLQPAPVTLTSDFALAVVSGETEAKALPQQLDPWVVEDPEGQADLYHALEDELLLSLPMVAYHSEQCIDPSLYSSGDAVEAEADSPFRVLEKLKRGKN